MVSRRHWQRIALDDFDLWNGHLTLRTHPVALDLMHRHDLARGQHLLAFPFRGLHIAVARIGRVQMQDLPEDVISELPHQTSPNLVVEGRYLAGLLDGVHRA